ncbi:hypothetical protein R3P38DRAFT_3028400 [Favolaschia claudopus]|uniref:DUF6534 domain-containing protein n=1 Tax=Favolaschia claudopus TaxID=2862362 RepID=A0AAW0AFN9_9AGAR
MSFDKFLGSILVASWANGMLLVVSCSQAYFYYRTFPKDHWATKGTVLSAIVVDFINVMANYASIYLYAITNWGDLDYLFARAYWPLYIYVLSLGASGFIVQNYLTFRYWRATKHLIVCGLVWLVSLTGMAASILTAVVVIQSVSNSSARNTAATAAIIWQVSASVANVALALLLVFQLRKMQSSFQSTQSIIQRLIRSAIQTGGITSILALTSLITYLAEKSSNVTVAFGYPLGRVYTITLLYNLNMRAEMRGASISRTRDTSSAGNNQVYGNGHSHAMTGDRIGLESLGGIHVHRTAIVKIDDGDIQHVKVQTETDEVSVRTQQDGKDDRF